MPRIVREADVSWEGNLARGTGAITAASSGAFEALGYSLPTRIAAPEGKTSPEELLAAAHGGCFTMSLAGELTGAGTPPGRLDVHCRITMDEVEGRGHLIVHSALDVAPRVQGSTRPRSRPRSRRRTRAARSRRSCATRASASTSRRHSRGGD